MIGVQWIGWDESVWDLQKGTSETDGNLKFTNAVRMTTGGIEGLNSLESETFTQTTALIDGQRFSGWRARPRTLTLPVLIGQSRSELDWLALDRAWWKTMRPFETGRLQVTAPDGSRRYIDARFENDGNQAFDRDPTRDRQSAAVIELIADDPWWKGTTFAPSFTAAGTASNFYGGAANVAPPFQLTKGSVQDTASVVNPGDVDAWPLYLIDGPATSFSASIDGHPVSATINVAANQQLQIDTAPDKQTAWMATDGFVINGFREGGTRENVTRLIGSVEFRPLPPGSLATLNVTIQGTGRITLSADPKYFRAW